MTPETKRAVLATLKETGLALILMLVYVAARWAYGHEAAVASCLFAIYGKVATR